MNPERFQQITSRYGELRVALIGDFCLDRYLEIDPGRQEVSIETGRPVHNVVNVRAQPGAAGTILNNLSALGVGYVYPVGFAGDDGEGYELVRALRASAGVRMDYFLQTPLRRTFTYCKPLVVSAGTTPRELDRLDSKNWTPTPAEVEAELLRRLRQLATSVDAIIVLNQVDLIDTGVITGRMLTCLGEIQSSNPQLLMLADSRTGLCDFPPLTFKMNLAELGAFAGLKQPLGVPDAQAAAADLARKNSRRVFVTLSEQGILGASPNGRVAHVPILPLRGPIDIVGAGDAVSANLGVALAAGADIQESLELANAAASIVIHKLGTTGTASIPELREMF